MDRGKKESMENYLETILMLKQKQGMVRSIDIVNELAFSKPSVSVAMKKLREAGLVEMDEEGYLTLTKEGQEKAEGVYEKHTVIMEALEILGVDSQVAWADACRIEHVIHEETFEKIKEFVKTNHMVMEVL